MSTLDDELEELRQCVLAFAQANAWYYLKKRGDWEPAPGPIQSPLELDALAHKVLRRTEQFA